ncbi:hypothetical protein B0T14DRAFT_46782 [Immersiella caudata]|uniref:Uncharacterized protein n=1 Tax=Immersiella caudata TaxID=314043 RepID=A0AA40CC93_9PEZI|nr:hypothetical protein B0T14DRAFT_46782 [Immersiella caudata]
METSQQARSNRDPFIFGSSDFQTQSAAPSNHATPKRDGLDQTRERTETPRPPRGEPNPWTFEMCFDYHKYEGGVETDATTQSDLFSEGSPETTPSALTAGSSVVTGPDLDDEDHEMIDAPISPEPHQDLPWPKEPNPDLPRHPTIHDHEDLTPHYEATPSPMPLHPAPRHTRRPSRASLPPTAGVRTRKVADTQKTREVRENSSCTMCKSTKVSRRRCLPEMRQTVR